MLKRHYPRFQEMLESIPDHRQLRTYSVAEILMAGLFMFIFMRGSQNDGTGTFSFDHEPYPECPHKTSKSGKTTWQAYVLEAKIVCSNQFSLSLATEWLQNSEDINQKQDCELNACKRLAEKMRLNYETASILAAQFAENPCSLTVRVTQTKERSPIKHTNCW